MTKNWYQVKYIPECFIFFKSKTLPNRNQKGKTLSNFAKICQTRDCHWRPKRRTRVNVCHQFQCYRWALSQLSPEKKTQALGEIRNHTHHIRHFRSLKENKITGADVLKNNSIKNAQTFKHTKYVNNMHFFSVGSRASKEREALSYEVHAWKEAPPGPSQRRASGRSCGGPATSGLPHRHWTPPGRG